MERKNRLLTWPPNLETEYICMTFAWNFEGRRSIRIPDYDYSEPGYYFVTICVKNRQCTFGYMEDGKMVLSRFGYIARREWRQTIKSRRYISPDAFIVMPNHVHAIVHIKVGRGMARHAPTVNSSVVPGRKFAQPQGNTLSSIVGSFKSAVSKCINRLGDASDESLWQRNFYERIVWTDEGLANTRDYIRLNTLRWHVDPENPYHPE